MFLFLPLTVSRNEEMVHSIIDVDAHILLDGLKNKYKYCMHDAVGPLCPYYY